MATAARKPILETPTQRYFIATVSLQVIVILTLVGVVFGLVKSHVSFSIPKYKGVPMYLVEFAIAQIFELSMAFDALRRRNVVQLIGILVFHLIFVVTASLEYRQLTRALLDPIACAADPGSYVQCPGPGTLTHEVEPFLIVVPSLYAAFGLVLVYLTRKLYFEFGWAIFHVVGADLKLKTMYKRYQLMIMLLKFDYFAYLGTEVQILIVVLQPGTASFDLSIASIPLSLFGFAFCGYSLRHEIKWMMVSSLVMMAASIGLAILKLVRYYKPYPNGESNPYLTSRDTLTIWTVSNLVLVLATVCVGLQCLVDFNKGLIDAKDHGVTKNNVLAELPSPVTTNPLKKSTYGEGEPLAARISIE